MKTFIVKVRSTNSVVIEETIDASRVTESGSFVYFWDDKEPTNIVGMFSTAVVVSIVVK